MNAPVDRAYLQRRRRESLARAEAAEDPGVARIHREFAEHYARRLDAPPSVAEAAPATRA